MRAALALGVALVVLLPLAYADTCTSTSDLVISGLLDKDFEGTYSLVDKTSANVKFAACIRSSSPLYKHKSKQAYVFLDTDNYWNIVENIDCPVENFLAFASRELPGVAVSDIRNHPGNASWNIHAVSILCEN